MPTIDLTTLVLSAGRHTGPEDGVSLMEATAWAAGEPWSEHPYCVSPVLASFGRELNNTLPDDLRQELKPFINRLLYTDGDGQDGARGRLALDWLMRTYAVAWLQLVPELATDADRLVNLPPIQSMSAVVKADDAIQGVKAHAGVAAVAAWSRVDTAEWDRAGAVAHTAVLEIAWPTARAVGETAGVDTAAALVDIAEIAARIAILTAADDDPLGATITTLQKGAIDLFGRMVNL